MTCHVQADPFTDAPVRLLFQRLIAPGVFDLAFSGLIPCEGCQTMTAFGTLRTIAGRTVFRCWPCSGEGER